jgi:hypothetical protein
VVRYDRAASALFLKKNTKGVPSCLLNSRVVLKEREKRAESGRIGATVETRGDQIYREGGLKIEDAISHDFAFFLLGKT